jgi:Tol biopolymer transport system component
VYAGLLSLVNLSAAQSPPHPPYQIGYTEQRIDLSGGQFYNWETARACVIGGDGSGRRELAPDLAAGEHVWTQFSGWSPDGELAIIGRAWETPENAAWEREHKTFRMTEGWLYDMFLCDPLTGQATNTTSVERVSDYNTGLFFWPGDPSKLGFTALLEGISHPFRMNLDGSGKEDLTQGSSQFTYGFSASPDGARIAYHMDYQVYLADSDGSQAKKVETGNPFNFCPTWSPEGKWLLFVSGEHYDCHPHVVGGNGEDLRKIADRGGYRGTVETLLEPDFHSESSDIPVWSPQGDWIYFTARRGGAIELCRVNLSGTEEQLTHSPKGVLNYHPKISPDGRWVVFGSTLSETGRQLYVLPSEGGEPVPLTQMGKGTAAYHAQWRPVPDPQ